MIAPVRQLRKKDIEWLGTNRCKHSHTYLEHYQCYVEEQPDDSPFHEHVGYLDIEASNFNANFGYMLSYCISDDNNEVLGRALKPTEIRKGVFDNKLVHQLCDDIRKFHRVVVYYGADHRFDLPFIRTRAIKAGAEFPLYKEIYCTDMWPIVRNKLKLHNNRLETVCRFFGIVAKTHPMDYDMWCNAMAGDKEALDYVWDHNVEDCISLKEVYDLLIPYAHQGKRSI